MSILLEACIGTQAAAQKAELAGAHQLELCDRLDVGGTTPARTLIDAVCSTVAIPVKVIIRPRGGDFVYSAAEVQAMKASLLALHDSTISGVVIGALTPAGDIDVATIDTLLRACLPIWSVTFHKAIDVTPDPVATAKALQQIDGITHILSSGGAATAAAGLATLLRMQDILADGPIELIAAGSITDANLPALHQQLGAQLYHGRKIVGDVAAE